MVDKSLECSFCGKVSEDVDTLITSGNGANICSTCVTMSQDIVSGREVDIYSIRTGADFLNTVYSRIFADTMQYLYENNNLKSLIIGISGGIDSTVTACLARDICNRVGIKVIGSYISIDSTEEEHERAKLVGMNFCDDFIDSIDAIYNNTVKEFFTSDIEIDHKHKIRCGNIKARIRMIYLYDLAYKYNGMVLSTDNLTEYLLGFWTLHGDVGDFGMIQNLWKTEVYALSNYLQKMHPKNAEALKVCHEADATDGLGITSTDIDQIMPYWKFRHETTASAYEEIDSILFDHIYYKGSKKDNPVIDRYKATKFKRRIPICIKRGLFF